MNNTFQRALEIIRNHTADIYLVNSFAKIIVFLEQHPENANYLNKNESPTSDYYIQRMANRFVNSRKLQEPSVPQTVSDSIVEKILVEFYEIDQNIKDALKIHMQAMGAENIVGYLLERYIASALEPQGWAWCSYPCVKAIDFIKPDTSMMNWELLQIKNRDNSENSSSAAIRTGTSIQKWFRTFAKTGKTNWEQFPDQKLCDLLSEESFQKFVSNYLRSLKHKHA